MLADIQGMRVLITGSSRGIGAAMAKALAGLGAAVAVQARPESQFNAQSLARELGSSAVAVLGSIQDPSATHKIVQEAAEGLGGLDVVIANAGDLVRRVNLEEVTPEDYEAVHDLNLKHAIFASQAALPFLKASRKASIITIGSLAAQNGGAPGSSLYASAKAGLLGWTRAMAKELAPHGIRANGIAPGVVLTEFQHTHSTPDVLEDRRKQVPLQRLGTPEDVAGAAVFLASPSMSGYVTGTVISVNGGLYL